MFYAGDKEKNQDRASSYAKKNGMSPIYRTVGGEFLNRIDTYRTFGKERFRKLWGQASRKYAYEARGEVKTFVCGASQRSIFRRYELPVLLNNKKISSINGMDRNKLRDFRHNTYNRLRAQGMDRRAAAIQAGAVSHRKTAMAEIRQDLAQAKKKE